MPGFMSMADFQEHYAEITASPEFAAAFGEEIPMAQLSPFDEPTQAPLPDDGFAEFFAGSMAGAPFELLADTRLERYAERIAWGIVNSLHMVASQIEREEDDDALGNVVKLPPPFTIGALPTSSPSRANDDVTVTWDASTSGDDMTMRVKGSCIFDEDFDIPGDSGSFVIDKGKLESTGGSNPETCDLEITMWRTRKGTVDSALDNESTIKATQKRTAKFTSAP